MMIKMGSHVAKMENGRNAFKILTGKPTEANFKNA